MSNDDMHRKFLEFGERHGLLTRERLKLDIGMLDEQSILMILELAYMAGMQEGAQTIHNVVRDAMK
jgi:hypothetical protein